MLCVFLCSSSFLQLSLNGVGIMKRGMTLVTGTHLVKMVVQLVVEMVVISVDEDKRE
jgi:hypothetical protein